MTTGSTSSSKKRSDVQSSEGTAALLSMFDPPSAATKTSTVPEDTPPRSNPVLPPPAGAAAAAVDVGAEDSQDDDDAYDETNDLSNSERVKAEIASFSAMAMADRDSFRITTTRTTTATDSSADNLTATPYANANALLGMFDPPPQQSTTANSERDAARVIPETSSTNDFSTANASANANANTASLLGMFAPPPPTNQAASSSSTGPGSSTLLSMFEPPPPNPNGSSYSSPDRTTTANIINNQSPSPDLQSNLQQQRNSLTSTMRHANSNQQLKEDSYQPITTEQTGLLQSIFAPEETTPKPQNNRSPLDYNTNTSTLPMNALVPPLMQDGPVHYVPIKQPLEGIQETTLVDDPRGTKPTKNATTKTSWKEFFRFHFQPSTFAGAFMFLLYHVVFCLANGSAIVRPHASKPILGEMSKLTTVGIFAAGPYYIARLGTDIPAVYPSVDLFLAPFLAGAARTVDQTLADDGYTANSNEIFFASFATVAAIGMFFAGLLLLLAATFKLANLGTFLPYSVLCGFFSAVGVLLWALAFSVDTNGLTWQHVFFSGDTDLILNSVMHHLPSLVVGILMNLLGPKHPFYVILLIIVTVVVFYTTMFVTGTTLEEAQNQQWFWSREELSIQAEEESEGWLGMWVPPAPMGHFGSMIQGKVHWGAVSDGLKDMAALAFLYLLRSSIHASAMKKNINNLVCKKRVKKPRKPETTTTASAFAASSSSERTTNRRHRKEPSYAQAAIESLSDNVRLVNESLAGTKLASGANQSIRGTPIARKGPTASKLEVSHADNIQDNGRSEEYDYIEERPPPCRRTLQSIFVEYGSALMVVSLSGGFGVCPTVATSNTMYAIGAGGPAPQYGSVLLLIIFYATDFDLVRYIPKACFSSLLVLGAVDTFVVWFFLSYRKTQDLTEWLVVPFIVLFSLVVGFLNAVFFGVAISTFVFVASFFRVGVVKFNATGLEIRSTIERSMVVADWLDRHGDYIQVLVLQNYLFFGNASSILAYIATMFEDVQGDDSPESSFDLPPMPKVLIIDMSLNTGMDTSTLDIFAEIKDTCKSNNCKLFLCGLSNRSKKGLSLTGVKPEPGLKDQRLVRFFPDLDTALGKAEDLISSEVQKRSPSPCTSGVGVSKGGFQAALKCIDEQHGQEFSKGLLELEPHTVAVSLQAGDRLFASDGGPVPDAERGLFFIESGSLKIERDANATLTRGRSTLTRSRSAGTLNNLHARSGTVGRQRAAMKASRVEATTQTFRLARIGPGWVCGAIEGASGLRHQGVHVAVTSCRLHHLSFQKLEDLEKEYPSLILNLYKMLSHLMGRRQEITIEQLATFHSIMSSPAHSKPISRKAMMALKR